MRKLLRRFVKAFEGPVKANPRTFALLFLVLFVPSVVCYLATYGCWLADPQWTLRAETGRWPKMFMERNLFHLYWLFSTPLKLLFCLFVTYMVRFLQLGNSKPFRFIGNVTYLLVALDTWFVAVNDLCFFIAKVA